MSEPPTSEPPTSEAAPGEAAPEDPVDEDGPWVAPRVLLRVPAPEQATSWSAGPIMERTVRQLGAQVSCGISFAARRAEVAELTEPGAQRKTTSADDILGGPMPARRRSPPVARVCVHVETDED